MRAAARDAIAAWFDGAAVARPAPDVELITRMLSVSVGEPVGEFSFWGVECLNPSENIWEGALPRPGPKPVPKPGPQLDRAPGRPVDRTPSQSLDPGLGSKAKTPVQFMLRCSQCGMRELVDVDETQIQTMRKLKGLVRGCPACGATVLWKGVAVKGPRSV